MPPPKRERASYIELIDRYRRAADRTWPEVDAATGVPAPTREAWMTGVTKNVPFAGIVRIARALDVPPDELFAAVIDDEIYEVGLERRGDIEQRLRQLEQTQTAILARLNELPTREQVRDQLAAEVRAADDEALARRARAGAPAREQ